MHLFEKLLSVSIEEIELELRCCKAIPWVNFLLNPRRLRGSDFLMRWSQGVWSEHRLLDAVNATENFYAIPYGPSSVAPHDDVRAFELYFERLENAGLGQIKRPDLLIFKRTDKNKIEHIVSEVGGIDELPFIEENQLINLLDMAIIAVECENSLWVAEKMPDYNVPLKPMKRLGGKPGLKKNAVLPTIIIKEEDRKPLFTWQNHHNIPIHIWHVFFDRAYGLALNEAQRLLDEGLIEATEQTFQAPGGATSQKSLYKFYYHYAYPLAVSIESPELDPAYIEDKNGHILPFVKFKGGTLKLLPEALSVLEGIKYDRS